MAHFRIREVILSREIGVSSLVSYNLVKEKMYMHISKTMLAENAAVEAPVRLLQIDSVSSR